MICGRTTTLCLSPDASTTRSKPPKARHLAGLSWVERIAALVGVAQDEDHGVLFLDNISRLAGIEDESGVEMARAVEPLSDAAKAANLSVLLNHHHKKGSGAVEDKSRGGTALAAATEINVEMDRPGGWTSRRRKLHSRGRVRATVWERVIEQDEDGRGYLDATGSPPVEGEPVDEAEQRLTSDRMTLARLGKATVKEFAEAIDRRDRQARNRLNELVEDGAAEVVPNSKPQRWRFVDGGAVQ